MASGKQIEANRRNAQRSTGPRTPEGKAAVAQNALQHGLFARKVLGSNNDERLQQYRDKLMAEYQPRTFTESALVEQMAVALFKRVVFEEVEAHVESSIADGGLDTMERIWRRQAALDRAFHKSLAELRKQRQSVQSKPATRPAPEAESKPAAECAPTPKLAPRPEPVAPTPGAPARPLSEPVPNDLYKYIMHDPLAEITPQS